MSRDPGRGSTETTPGRSVPGDRHRWRWPARVALLVLVVSLLPVPGRGAAGGGSAAIPVPFGLDPFVASHLLGYAVLAACCLRALETGTAASPERSRLRLLAVAVMLTAGYGAAIEALQVPIPWRSGGVADAGINAVGAISGVVADSVGRWRRRSRC
ncbi:VanZ family protein [Halopenitus persicus]|uniref:VanZ family protein n=1 Tax=Halopenitus persicus TaxID=1048396 RepID=UPI000BBAE354|nr:VanZ family protein [Halopenitus persicus]